MVDNVVITGTTDGALKAGFGDMPPWATEDTLIDMLAILKNSKSYQEASMHILKSIAKTTLDPKKWKELDELLDQINEDLKEQHERHKEKEKDDKKDHEYAVKQSPLYRLLTDSQYRFEAGLRSASAALVAIVQTMVTNVKTFRHLHEAGIATATDMDETRDVFDSMRQMAILAGMSVENFGKIVEKSAGANAITISRFAKTLPAVSKELVKYGFDVKQAAETQAAYTDTLVALGVAQHKTQEELEDGGIAFGKSLSRLALVAGVSRQKILENVAAVTQSTDASVIAATIGEENAVKFSQFIASFKDQNIGQQFLKMMSSRIPALNSTFQNFVKAGFGTIGMQAMKFTKSLAGLSPERAALATKNFVEGIRNFDGILRQLEFLANAGVEGAEESLRTLNAMRQMAASAKPLEAIKEQERAAEAAAKVRNAWEGITGTLSQIFAPTIEEVEFFGEVLGSVNKTLGSIGAWMRNTKIEFSLKSFHNTLIGMVDSFKNFDAKKMFESVKTSIAEAWANFSWNDLWKSIVDGFTKAGDALTEGFKISVADLTKYVLAAIVAFGALSRIISAVGAAFKFWRAIKTIGAAGGIAGGAAGAAGGAAGGALGGIGSGLGKLGTGLGDFVKGLGSGAGGFIKGIMEGIALGLKAFGQPGVLKGAIILSLAIAAISASVAFSMWLIGEALPTFAKGIKEFDGIDGDNLVEVAKGIAALGGAILLFTTGGALAAVGQSIGAVGDFFARLFGGGTLIDQFTKFAEIGPGLSITANAIHTLAMSISELSSSLNSFAGSGKLSEIIGVARGAGNLSVPKSPSLSTIRSPSAVSSNPEFANVTTGASSTLSGEQFTTGIDKSPVSTETNNLISIQNSLLSQILECSNKNLRTNQEILKRTHT